MPGDGHIRDSYIHYAPGRPDINLRNYCIVSDKAASKAASRFRHLMFYPEARKQWIRSEEAERVFGSDENGIPASEHETTIASNASGTSAEPEDSALGQSHDNAAHRKESPRDTTQTSFGKIPSKPLTHIDRFHTKQQEQKDIQKVLKGIALKKDSVSLSRELGLESPLKEQQTIEDQKSAEEQKKEKLISIVSQTEMKLRKLTEAYDKKQVKAYKKYYEVQNNIRSKAEDATEIDEEIYNNFLKVSKENEKKFSDLDKEIDEKKEKQKKYTEEIFAYLSGKESIFRRKEAGIYSIRKKQILLEALMHRRIIKIIGQAKEAMKKVIPEEHKDPSG